MLITLIVLAVLNLLVLGYIAWRMPKPANGVNVVHNCTVGDVVALSQMRRTKAQAV